MCLPGYMLALQMTSVFLSLLLVGLPRAGSRESKGRAICNFSSRTETVFAYSWFSVHNCSACQMGCSTDKKEEGGVAPRSL